MGMQEKIFVTGMVIRAFPYGEYDRGVIILTKERGKITAFAKGARKASNRLGACTNVFSFGVFTLYEGKHAYTLLEADIKNYFEELRTDYIGACYGMYFAEVTEYYTKENNDEKEMLKLLYQSLRALIVDSIPDELVRCIFEIKSVVVNGEYPGVHEEQYLEDTRYTIHFIVNSSVSGLYVFNVKDEILEELKQIAGKLLEKALGHHFKSLDVLESLY